MSNIKQLIKKQATKLATAIATKERNTWPPVCIGIYYQPERPQQAVSGNSVDTEA